MNLRWLVSLRAVLITALSTALSTLLFTVTVAAAAEITENTGDVSLRLTVAALGDDVQAKDPRVAQTRVWINQVIKATGEEGESVAAASVRLSRYLFDVTKIRVSPLEVLEAVAKYAPAGKPLNETTQRYFDLRAKQKLDHVAALAAMAAK